MSNSTFTSESVCAGHPDKICDQISDAIVDAALREDKNSRVAVETMVTEDFVAMVGEVKSRANLSYEEIARQIIRDLGYTDPGLKFTDRSPITVKIHSQSPEISAGVDKLGAGDQGMMFGYACDETPELMPLPIMLAHNLAQKIDETRNKKLIPFLKPDGKTQATVNYEDDKPKRIEQVVLAVPHSEEITKEELKKELYTKVVQPVLVKYGYKIDIDDIILNGTGVWHLSGPSSDSGVTGRKIVVDGYGGMARVGGGAFSGKDPTKVDRSGAYAARFLAKNIVAASLARRAEVRLAFFIGGKEPVMLDVETFGTEKKDKKYIISYMKSILDLTVAGILRELSLQHPVYLKTAAYGHFGRAEFPWERTVSKPVKKENMSFKSLIFFGI